MLKETTVADEADMGRFKGTMTTWPE